MNLHPKVVASSSVGAIVTVLVALAGALGYTIPPDVAAALVTILVFAAGYLKRA